MTESSQRHTIQIVVSLYHGLIGGAKIRQIVRTCELSPRSNSQNEEAKETCARSQTQGS